MIEPRIGVLDYGSGNLHSACRALEAAGAQVRLGSRADEFAGADALVVPGVGAFAACMSGLRSIGGDDLVRDWVDSGRKLLGICVGHQVLFAHGVERGEHADGIGIFPGTVERLTARRLPHMGWNTVETPAQAGVFEGLGDRRFYFVHSYGVHATDAGGVASVPADARITWCEHEEDRFIAAVQWGSVTSTQFHPEKSGAAGAQLLRHWLLS